MTGKSEVRVRRVYDEPSPEDGTRVLVDRIWPRGLAKATAEIDEWAKVVARPPSCGAGTDTIRTSRHDPVGHPGWMKCWRRSAGRGRRLGTGAA
jgi:uncharacterized protein YeaO (DUF488 family)